MKTLQQTEPSRFSNLGLLAAGHRLVKESDRKGKLEFNGFSCEQAWVQFHKVPYTVRTHLQSFREAEEF